jgi:platelet-activating factor acetylhydrolase IB subunit alpha
VPKNLDLTDPAQVMQLAKSIGDAVPREPEKLKLQGHRARVTKVAFHPRFQQLATSSEDGSIKIWDCETGECE